MLRSIVLSLLAVFFLGACNTGPNTQSLREEVDSLKAVVAEIQALPQIKKWIAANKPLDVSIDLATAPSLGDENAPITIIEFSDYQCPYCERHVKNTLPDLKAKYVETGKVRYVFMDYPINSHKLAPKASEAAHCAGEQDKYWEMHDILFDNRAKLQVDNLKSFARTIGLDTRAFDECLDSDKYAPTVRKHFQIGNQQLNVTATPSFRLGYTSDDGKSVRVVAGMRGAKSLSSFDKEIETLLASD